MIHALAFERKANQLHGQVETPARGSSEKGRNPY